MMLLTEGGTLKIYMLEDNRIPYNVCVYKNVDITEGGNIVSYDVVNGMSGDYITEIYNREVALKLAIKIGNAITSE